MKKRFIVPLISVVLACALMMPALLAMPAMAQDYPFDPGNSEVSDALDYLKGEQQADGSISDFATSAWAVMAIAAASEYPHDWAAGGDSIVNYLADNAEDATTVTDYARMILAIAAAEEDPADFGGVNFVALLEAEYDGTQIGDGSLLNDDFWGVLALITAGKDDDSGIIQNTVSFIKDNQNDDGGWSWGIGQDSDVDDTAAAIMALEVAGEGSSSDAIQDGLEYIKSTQMDNGGFESWGATNSATDSWAIGAIVAAGENPTGANWTENDNTPVDDLLSFQNTDGSFNWQQGTPSNKELMTAYAIPALLGTPYPVVVLEEDDSVSVYVRVEGEFSTIWSGGVSVSDSTIIDDQGSEHYLADPTALGALDEASKAGNFPYVVQDTAYGLYLYSVNGEEPGGVRGWMYRVDYHSPMVGAADFILDQTTSPDPPHQEVLFYYGEWGQLPLKLALDKTVVDVGEEFTASVTYYDDDTGSWSLLEGATVHADQDYVTDANGEAEISISDDGTFPVFAEKDDYIRSGKIAVTVGTGVATEASVSLTATIVAAISIDVEPSSIAFGELAAGEVGGAHSVTVENRGTRTLSVTASVTDQAQGLFVQGLRLDNDPWGSFETTLAAEESQEVQVRLHVPENYAGVGEKEGTLTFWANQAP